MPEPAVECDQIKIKYNEETSLEFIVLMSAALSSDEGSGRAEFRKSFNANSTLPGHQELRKWLSEHDEIILPSNDELLGRFKHFTRIKKRKIKAIESICDAASPIITKTPRKLSDKMLLVFDLNHVLLHRVPASLSFIVRPYAIEFIKNISNHFHLAVWTSGKRQNVSAMFESIFFDVETLFFWCQEKCRIMQVDPKASAVSSLKKSLIFHKPLCLVWSEFPEFDESNTLLIDDSPEKCCRNPPGTWMVPLSFEGSSFDSYLNPCRSDGLFIDLMKIYDLRRRLNLSLDVS